MIDPAGPPPTTQISDLERGMIGCQLFTY